MKSERHKKCPTQIFRNLVLLLFALVLLVKFINVSSTPFYEDETLYAEMVAEEAENPSIIPTYLGYHAPWKPGLSFFAYSLFLPISSTLFSSLEYIYRFPILVFGLLNAYLFYLLSKRFYGEETALLATLVFYSSLSAFYMESRLLVEPFMLSMILLSLLYYTSTKITDWKRFALGALFSFLAALTKSVIALVIPFLVLAHMIQKEPNKIASPAFLLSLLGAPAGLALFWLSLSQIGLAEYVFFKDTAGVLMEGYSVGLLFNMLFGMGLILVLILPSFVAALFSFRSAWKTNLMFSAWFLILFLLLFLGQRMWYYYYVMPAVALFASRTFLAHGKSIDFFAFMAAGCLVIISFLLIYFNSWNLEHQEFFPESKAIGLSLSGKENVLFVGTYQSNTISVIYKVLDERQKYGKYMDFGYALFCPTDSTAIPPGAPRDFVQDYWRDDYRSEDEKFAYIFRENLVFRKGTGIRQFDYVVISPPIENLSLEGYSTYFNGNYSTILIRGD